MKYGIKLVVLLALTLLLMLLLILCVHLDRKPIGKAPAETVGTALQETMVPTEIQLPTASEVTQPEETSEETTPETQVVTEYEETVPETMAPVNRPTSDTSSTVTKPTLPPSIETEHPVETSPTEGEFPTAAPEAAPTEEDDVNWGGGDIEL